jgi:hypothetical protein
MNFLGICTLASCLLSAVFAAPVHLRRQNNATAGNIDDSVILNYALTLEFLEAEFYKQGLNNFSDTDFQNAGFVGVRDRIVEIGGQEQTHADFLSGSPFERGTHV